VSRGPVSTRRFILASRSRGSRKTVPGYISVPIGEERRKYHQLHLDGEHLPETVKRWPSPPPRTMGAWILRQDAQPYLGARSMQPPAT
jgi:hypothetical protein